MKFYKYFSIKMIFINFFNEMEKYISSNKNSETILNVKTFECCKNVKLPFMLVKFKKKIIILTRRAFVNSRFSIHYRGSLKIGFQMSRLRQLMRQIFWYSTFYPKKVIHK